MGAFDKLRKLEWLYLSNNAITSLVKNSFVELESLKYLYLDINDMRTIETGVFEGLTLLQHLDLSSNYLTTVNGSTLEGGLTNLKTLYLCDNNGKLNIDEKSIQKVTDNNLKITTSGCGTYYHL